jgi:hypothetical protein
VKKGWLWIVGALLLLGWWATRDRAPEDRIARRLRGLCPIAREGISRPSHGVDRLFAHLGEHTAETLRDLGELVVELQRIDDPSRHAARARQANRTMAAPLSACQADLSRFADAVERDAEASARLERGLERLERTLNLLFGTSALRLRELSGLYHSERSP